MNQDESEYFCSSANGQPSRFGAGETELSRWKLFLGLGGLFCVILVIYASIVPLDFKPLTWQESLERWSSIPWLSLGVWERADWIANTLIFIPPTFLLSGYYCISAQCGALGSVLRWLAGIACFALLVLGIELIQIWFPPRTVSWNDVAAGILGVILGGIAWPLFGPALGRWSLAVLQQRPRSTKVASLTILAMLVCTLYNFYPFDMVFSLAELEVKRAQGRIRGWTALSSAGLLSIGQSWVVAAMRLFPFGAWLAWKARPFPAVLGICFLAVLLELVQIPIFSKHAAGDEIPAGILGGLAGWLVFRNAGFWRSILAYPGTWLLFIATWIVALLCFFVVRSHTLVTDSQQIAERWWGMLSPPLSRYYYTSEYSALSNLAGKLGVFGILGLLVAGYTLSRFGGPRRVLSTCGFVVAGILGIAIEILQVYRYPFIADLSDIVVYLLGYAFGSIAGFWLLADSPDDGRASAHRLRGLASQTMGKIQERV